MRKRNQLRIENYFFNSQLKMFSALILLCRLFPLAARHRIQAFSALAPQRRLRFPLQAEIEKTKVFRFPLSVFRFLLSLWRYV